MSTHEPWDLDVVAALERRIAGSGARPDFLDVVTRAHAIDPVAVPEAAVAEADAMEAASADADAGGRPQDDDAALDGWLHDVRAAVERRVEARRDEALPSLPAPPPRRGVWWLAGAAVAAAALLVLGVGQAVRMVATTPTEPPEQALHMNDAVGSTGTVEAMEPRPLEAPKTRHAPAVPAPVEAIAPLPAPAPEATLPAPPPKAQASTARSDRERLRALADEAQAHWRAGRREQAQRAFATIVAEAGRTRAAEMAYADLFTLASQAGDAAAQRRWWKEYLRRFPRGRFADDARAGLCRVAVSSNRAACWQAYLDDFPKGSFRGEARSALGQEAP